MPQVLGEPDRRSRTLIMTISGTPYFLKIFPLIKMLAVHNFAHIPHRGKWNMFFPAPAEYFLS